MLAPARDTLVQFLAELGEGEQRVEVLRQRYATSDSIDVHALFRKIAKRNSHVVTGSDIAYFLRTQGTHLPRPWIL